MLCRPFLEEAGYDSDMRSYGRGRADGVRPPITVMPSAPPPPPPPPQVAQSEAARGMVVTGNRIMQPNHAPQEDRERYQGEAVANVRAVADNHGDCHSLAKSAS